MNRGKRGKLSGPEVQQHFTDQTAGLSFPTAPKIMGPFYQGFDHVRRALQPFLTTCAPSIHTSGPPRGNNGSGEGHAQKILAMVDPFLSRSRMGPATWGQQMAKERVPQQVGPGQASACLQRGKRGKFILKTGD